MTDSVCAWRYTSIGSEAFYGCKNLTSITIPDTIKKPLLTKDVFGDSFPDGLTHQAMELTNAMADGALKQYILTEEIWEKLSAEERFTLFMTRQNKSCLPSFIKRVNKEVSSDFASRILEIIKGTPSANECNAVAAFVLSFDTFVEVDLLKQMYNALKNAKNGAKAVSSIEKDNKLMNKLSTDVVELTEIEEKIVRISLWHIPWR